MKSPAQVADCLARVADVVPAYMTSLRLGRSRGSLVATFSTLLAGGFQQRPATSDATLALNIACIRVFSMNSAQSESKNESGTRAAATTTPPDPAERIQSLRLFYRGWHPTRLGK